jgi:hypothetical protein
VAQQRVNRINAQKEAQVALMLEDNFNKMMEFTVVHQALANTNKLKP